MTDKETQKKTGRWQQFRISRSGVLLHSVLTGIGGVVILLIFFSMMLSSGAVVILLPCIVAFNAASAGYGLAERWPVPSGKKSILITVAIILAITGSLGIPLLYPWEDRIDLYLIVLNGIAAFIGVFTGAWISSKKQTINTK